MAVNRWWLGEPTETTAKVVCRSNATATVTVGCNGQTFTGAADSAVQDGIVEIAVTGLAANQSYPYTIDGAAAGTLKTKKTTGDVWIATGSCWHADRPDVIAMQLLADYDLDLYVALGDFPYANTTFTRDGETGTNVESSMAAGKSVANYYKQHRIFRHITGMRELMASVPFMYMPDDHEYPFNDGCPTWLAGYQATVTGAGAATQTDLDEAWTASRTASEAYGKGWTTGFNSSAATVDADALYGSYKIGPVEVFMLDCCNYRSPIIAADNASKTMLGAAQKARFIDAVTSSTATFKFVAIPKQLFKGGGNTDTWNPNGSNLGYMTERNEILYALRNVTGLLFAAGDQHLWSDQWVEADDLGAGYPAVSCLVGCPTSVDLNTTGVLGYETGVRSKVNGYPAATSVPRDAVCAVFRFTDSKAYRYLLSMRRGLIPCGYIDAGSNQVQYPQMRFG